MCVDDTQEALESDVLNLAGPKRVLPSPSKNIADIAAKQSYEEYNIFLRFRHYHARERVRDERALE